jgi:hypothetical protein
MEHFPITGDNSFLQFFLMEAVVEGKNVPALPHGGLDVVLTVNGVECKIVPVLEYIEKQMNDMIERKAGELLKDKISKLESVLSELTNGIKYKAARVGVPMSDG